MQQQDMLRILSTATVTQGLEPTELEWLLQHATLETAPQGSMVLAEGQRGEALYVVLSGQLKVKLLKLDSAKPGRCASRIAAVLYGSVLHAKSIQPL